MDLLETRYASPEMGTLFSQLNRACAMRKVWLALASAQQQAGLQISDEQIKELKDHLNDVDLERVAFHEASTHHDLVAHLRHYAEQCPKAAPILHWGATSATITDNADALLIREGLLLLIRKLRPLLEILRDLAKTHKTLLCLSYTHFQPAQPTTFGKRAALWAQDLLSDLEGLREMRKAFPCLGAKGTTGSQGAFLSLLQTPQKVAAFEWRFVRLLGFDYPVTLSTQTYSRKADSALLDTLSQLALSLSKFGNDIRLLSHMGEVNEPFANTQVGSSAMPYKHNPILSERICSLARHLITLSQNPKNTAATQWLERSLDDSANRRLTFPQAFLTADALIDLGSQVAGNLKIDKDEMDRRLEKELPQLMTEPILMECVKQGKDRQKLHEKLRIYCEKGTIIEAVVADPDFPLSAEALKKLMEPANYLGCIPEQIEYFLREKLAPTLANRDMD